MEKILFVVSVNVDQENNDTFHECLKSRPLQRKAALDRVAAFMEVLRDDETSWITVQRVTMGGAGK